MFIHPSVVRYYLLVFIPLFYLPLITLQSEVQITVALDASFRLQLFPKTLDNGTNCTLTNPRNVATSIPLDYQGINSQIEDQRILPLGNNQCGVRIHHANSSDVGKWILTLSNSDEKFMSETFRIRTVTSITSVETTSTAMIGDLSATIHCGPTNMLYCELRDPLGNVATLSSTTRCETVLQGVKATDFGIWKCIVGVSGSASEIQATHTLENKDSAEKVVILSNQTSIGTLISWQVQRIIPAALWCRAFPPNGKSILVLPGLETENYVSAGTDLTENKCGLLINGEFLQEYHGIWRLEMGLTSRRTIGGFIIMPEGKTPGVDENRIGSSSPTQQLEMNVEAGKPFVITCQTQYPAGYCWIKGPQGQMITLTDELTLGRCSHTITNAEVKEHNGTWTCNVAHINGGHEEHMITRVNVIDKLYQAVNPERIVRRGDKTVIACQSVFNYPLQYCRFVRPDGTGLGVTPMMIPSGRYSYEGPGLDHGWCGLAISSVETIDFGEWTCVSKSRLWPSAAENCDTISLQLPEISVASVIGLTLGVVVLVVVAAGILLLRYRRKRSRDLKEVMVVEYSN